MNVIKKTIDYLLCAFIFLLPVSTVFIISERFIGGYKFQYGSFAIYAVEILFWIIVVLYLLINRRDVINKLQNFKSGLQQKPILLFLLLIFIVIGFISIFFAIDRESSFYAFFRTLEVIAIFSFLLLNLKFKYFWIFLASGFVQGLVSIYQFFTQEIIANKYLGIVGHKSYEAGALVVEGDGRWLRSYGLVNDPNLLGAFMVFVLFIGLYLFLKSKNKLYKILILINLVVCSAGLFFSFSRGAIIGLVVGLIFTIVFYIFKSRNDLKKLVAYTFGIVLVFITLSIIYLPLIQGRVLVNNRLELKSVNERVQLANESSKIIKNNWLTGTGIGNYTYELIKLKPGLSAYNYQPVHNTYLLILAEIGIFGLVVFILIGVYIFKYGWKFKNYLFLGLLISFIFVGFWEHFFWTTWQGMALLWIGIILVIKICEIDKIK